MTPTSAPRDRSPFEVWAPRASMVTIRIDGAQHQMVAGDDGWFSLPGVVARTGQRYAYRMDDGELWVPDPRSISQPDGVHGDSEIWDPRSLPRPAWAGRDVRGGVIYEMHVGTFTAGPAGRGGTFDSAIGRLDHLAELGVDAIEVMPVAAFPGDRGWGYDGVNLYATQASYGGPAAFLRFIDAAHEHGIAVLLDVVYNHLGPAGNYLGMFGPYFTDRHHTPWGQAVNLDDEGAEEVRAFLIDNARQWLVDFGLDGLRLDAVHELRDDSPRHLLAELSDAVRAWEAETGRPLTLIAESDRNDPLTVTPTAAGGVGMDMQWADDIHHAVHAWISGERQGYYVDFGSAEVLGRALTRMFEHAGTYSTFRGRVWGALVDPASEHYDAHSFVAFLEDHDQVGNRAVGDRIHQLLSPAQHAAAASLILLGAATPMLFQGEEWATGVPFTFFTSHDTELGPLVSKGRIEEFAAMGWDSAEVPDPQERSTFTSSFLDWEVREQGDNARMLAWYRRLIALRRSEPDLSDPSLEHAHIDVLSEETVLMRRGRIGVLAHRGPGPVTAERLLGAEVLARFEDGESTHGEAELGGPGALVVRLLG